ncbi:MAG: 2-oxo acid dehydrogenase subunit E2 [Eubacterium sp.]|nr:2-oxo acid dehydrogenase subunit E2 [Eubacterium sp.]
MASDIILPKLGMDMQTGTIMKWYKNEGDTVVKGEPLFELMTDKVNMEVEAETSGVLLKKYYDTGAELPVFTVIGALGEVGELVAAPARAASGDAQLVTDKDRAALKALRSGGRVDFPGGREAIRATPAARRLAAEHGLALNQITGSGPKGRIQVEDVEKALNTPKIVQKTEIPQQRVFEGSGNDAQGVEANHGLADVLDKPLADLVAGMDELEAELGVDAKPKDSEDTTKAEPAAQEGSGLVSPLAAKIAAVEGVDLTEVVGSGPDGKILKEDVLVALKAREEAKADEKAPEKAQAGAKAPKAAQKPVPRAEKVKSAGEETLEKAGAEVYEAVSPKRKIIAERMVKSNLENAVITLTTEIDMTEVKELRKKIGKKVERETGCRCTYTDFLMVSVSQALMEHPYINCSYEDGAIVLHDYVNLGLAVGMDDGLVVPVMDATHQASFSEMVEKRSALLKQVKAKKLTADDFTGSTFTVTNLGMYGILEFSAIINQPNSAILSVGEVVERARVVKGEIVPRSVMRVSLNLDHRVADGMAGAKFLQTVKESMENPTLLLF